jgi:hypothetical protein
MEMLHVVATTALSMFAAPRPRTRTVVAVLEVSLGYHNDELAIELEHPGDIVRRAAVHDDRRTTTIPVQRDRRGTTLPMPRYVPARHDPRAF